jgi:carnitine O-acetyltransferase
LGDLSADLPAPQLLEFEISDTVQAYITNAHIQFDAQVARHDLQVVTFDGYGKTLVKQMQVSPDAFAQMAIQLAYYKMYGRSRPTYESAQTKQFLYGRTETCRSVSVESVEWCKAMQNPNESVKNLNSGREKRPTGTLGNQGTIRIHGKRRQWTRY